MLIKFSKIARYQLAASQDLADYDEKTVWIDAVNPSEEELNNVSKIVGFDLPNYYDMAEIELSNRLYKHGTALVMIANLISKSKDRSQLISPVAFVLKKNLLITIRYDDFNSFERVAASLTKSTIDDEEDVAENIRPLSIFCDLIEEAVGDRADSLEIFMRGMEELAGQLFSISIKYKNNKLQRDHKLESSLKLIGTMGEKISNIRESITSLQRLVNFAKAHLPESSLGEQAIIIDSIKNDLLALSDEASFLINRLAFNLDATLGMINIEETKIMRLLSIVTLVISPPMLIAGVYGMNFRLMPELEWGYGYFYALLLILASATVPLLYLHRKKWI